MKDLLRATLAVACCLLPSSAFADTDSAIANYMAGMRAREAGDHALYARSMQAAIAEIPGHAVLWRHVAQAHALAGEKAPMLEALAALRATGASFDLAEIEDFDAYREDPDFRKAMRGIEANAESSGTAEIYATLPDPLLVPEGMAYDPASGRFFVSSLRQRKIVQVDREGHVRDFAANHEDYFGGLGLMVDAARGLLWGVSASFPGMSGHEESNDGWSSLCAFDLESGALERSFVLKKEEEQRHNFNDLALAPDGRIVLTDAMSGALYTLAPGADALELFLPVGTLSGPNGIAVDGTGERIYVAQYNLDIVCVDAKTREVQPLARGPEIATFGVDGLYWRRNQLIAVQNHPSLDRVARFDLGADGVTIERVEVLARRLPAFEEPTTGAFVGDEFVFLANSQITVYDQLEAPVEASQLQPVVLLRVGLGPPRP